MKRSAVALKNSQCPSILLFWPIKSTAKGTTIKILHFELPENQCQLMSSNSILILKEENVVFSSSKLT